VYGIYWIIPTPTPGAGRQYRPVFYLGRNMKRVPVREKGEEIGKARQKIVK
jgi:hypothetical protein